MKNQGMELSAQHGNLSRMLEISRSVYSSLNLEEVLCLILLQAAKTMDAQICSLRLLDKEKGLLEMQASYGLSNDYLKKGPLK